MKNVVLKSLGVFLIIFTLAFTGFMVLLGVGLFQQGFYLFGIFLILGCIACAASVVEQTFLNLVYKKW